MEISMDNDKKEKRILGDYDYTDWIRNEIDVSFDRKWHILQMIALLFASIGLFFFVIHIFFF